MTVIPFGDYRDSLKQWTCSYCGCKFSEPDDPGLVYCPSCGEIAEEEDEK